MREPAGSSMVTSMEPEEPRIWFLIPEVAIRRTPSRYSTVVRCAVFTSRLLEAFAGRTRTVVSARSAAMNWTRPAGMSRTAEIGVGVSKVCMMSCGAWLLFVMRTTIGTRPATPLTRT